MKMKLGVISDKGGVGKTTSAIHLAAYFHQRGSTVLADGDYNRSACVWGYTGRLPFVVCPIEDLDKKSDGCEYLVVDTGARPSNEELADLVQSLDYLVVCTTPDGLSLSPLLLLVDRLKSLKAQKWCILLTRVSKGDTDASEARQFLENENNLPVFKETIQETKLFKRAFTEGVLVNQVRLAYLFGGMGWKDYVAVGKEIYP